jgi:hypothetical protein
MTPWLPYPGRTQIGSAALVADGYYATLTTAFPRTLTSDR